MFDAEAPGILPMFSATEWTEPHDPKAPEDDSASVKPPYPLVKLICFELFRYRRLRAVRLDLHDDTTMLVGSNNSGKSSLLIAIQKFLSHATIGKGQSDGFSAYDLCADGWKTLVALGRAWEQAPNSDSETLHAERETQLAQILELMPVLDVWFEAQDGAWHLVRDLIPSLEWTGGMVGVRLRLEPASTREDLDRLIEGYRAAKLRLQSTDEDAERIPSSRRVWPRDLFDYLKKTPSHLNKVVAYRLDPQGLKPPNEMGEAQPQSLADGVRPQGEVSLRHLLRVDFIPAQRGLGTEEAAAGAGLGGRQLKGLLSHQLVRYAKGILERNEGALENLDSQRSLPVARALEKAHILLDDAVNQVLADRINEVRDLGHGLGQALDLVVHTDVDVPQTLRHASAVQYRSSLAATDAQHLPEHAIGLGYQNLLALSFALMGFRDERLLPPKAENGQASLQAPAVHLVLLEEPEAHLHVQVQRTFIRRAHNRLVPKDRPELATQLLVSTHSSHLAHAVDFANLRYLRRMPREKDHPLPTSVIVSLSGIFGKGNTAEEDTLRFVQRYLRVQHNDLLFADAAVLMEGTAERVLVPAFIERDHKHLRRRYLSLLDVGGSHAHRLMPLLKLLGLPTLVLSDLDPVGVERKKDSRGTIRVTHPKCPTTVGPGLLSANPTIKELLGINDVDTLVALHKEKKLLPLRDGKGRHFRIAYQVPANEGEPCPSSFEDALLLENRDWFTSLPEPLDGAIRDVSDLAKDNTTVNMLAERAHGLIGSRSFDKGAFALDLFMRLPDSYDGRSLVCPRYMREGLTWLESHLDVLDATTDGG